MAGAAWWATGRRRRTRWGNLKHLSLIKLTLWHQIKFDFFLSNWKVISYQPGEVTEAMRPRWKLLTLVRWEKIHLSFILFAEVDSSRGWSYMKEARDVNFEVRKIKEDVNIVSWERNTNQRKGFIGLHLSLLATERYIVVFNFYCADPLLSKWCRSVSVSEELHWRVHICHD